MSGPSPQHHFRRRSALALHEGHYGPNMTPMVDVVMVILVFFMASAAILGPEWFVATRLPRAGAASASSSDTPPLRLVVKSWVDGQGQTRARINDGADFGMSQARTALEQAMQGRDASTAVVLIDPDPSTPYADVVTLHAAAKALGVVKVGLGQPAPPAAQPPTPQPLPGLIGN